MRLLIAAVIFALPTPALSSGGAISAPLHGFRAEQTSGLIHRNPLDAIGADPRFEPEQVNPSITIEWTRDRQGHLWADVVYRNPDMVSYAFKNERFEFAERAGGDWDMVGSWSRWKCLGAGDEDWTTKEC